MIEFKTGDLFDDPSLDAIGHGVNCAGAMGKGIALEFRRRWPRMYEAYRRFCNAGRLRPGDVFVWDESGQVVFNLATQLSWRTQASIGAISKAVSEMLHKAEYERQLKRVGIPRIGCGLGGLDWEDVREVLVEASSDSTVALVVFSLEAE